MSSSIVIKVKFGETLRRFNASINDKKLALDIAMLREKIRNLFSFDSGAEFTMTYVDEDGDVITLADDADLHDAARQSLNPLRITVTLNLSKPVNSLQNQFPISTLKSGVSDMLKSVHEPIREVLANLPLDLAAKAAASSSPTVADLVEKMTAVYMDQILGSSKVNQPASGPSNANPNVNPESSAVNDVKVPVNTEAGSSNLKKKDKQVQNGVDLNVPYFQYEPLQKKEESATENVSGSEKKEESDTDFGGYSGWVQGMLKPSNQCPFGGMPLPTEHVPHRRHHRHSRGPHWKRHNTDINDSGNVIHRGVVCDGCGVHPITGPRYKSKVKADYDLCRVCFAGTENVTDYMRIDYPINGFRHHAPFKGLHDLSYRIAPPTLPLAFRAPGSKLPRSKLDSRFILDVNVLDGTIMAPLTTFTKIWRMRNNGSIIWPHGSQLHWIGGDRLSNSLSVDVEIPVDGLPVDQELDVAVDFIAPELPGRYVSYWRMASPSGQKYGQRVWVLIHVDASMKDLGQTSINLNLPPVVSYPEVANQDQPLVDKILSGNNIIKITDSENSSAADSQLKNQEMNFPINDSLIIDSPITTVSSPTAPTGPVSSSGFDPATAYDIGSFEPISYPTVDFSAMPPVIGASGPSSPTAAVAATSATKKVNIDQEQSLVKDLEDMGFKELDLNKEVLRMNNYDLEKSIDDLCGVSDWDPMLDELQEMGFEDNEANMRLLKKNNGSIKRAVMDLINGEKA